MKEWFTTSEVCKVLKISYPKLMRLKEFYNIQPVSFPALDNSKMYNKELIERMGFKWDAFLKCDTEIIDKQEKKRVEHPLVMDERFFEESYFPETTPSCFSDLDD